MKKLESPPATRRGFSRHSATPASSFAATHRSLRPASSSSCHQHPSTRKSSGIKGRTADAGSRLLPAPSSHRKSFLSLSRRSEYHSVSQLQLVEQLMCPRRSCRGTALVIATCLKYDAQLKVICNACQVNLCHLLQVYFNIVTGEECAGLQKTAEFVSGGSLNAGGF